MMFRILSACFILAGLVSWPAVTQAHWCSNIFSGPARLVVKPEQSTVHLTGSKTALKVYLQNNFPYKLTDVRLRGQSSGYTIEVSPEAQAVHPGQNVVYTVSITGSGDVEVSTLNLQVRIRVGDFRGSDDKLVDQNPSQEALVGSTVYEGGGDQSPSFGAATLFDRYPSATLSGDAPSFGRTGIEQLILWFGYRFCFSSSGSWRCGGENCPSPCAEKAAWTSIEQFPQNCMRAGIDLGIRKAQLGSHLQAARDGAINAMKGGSEEHKCLAAVVGGLLWQGASSTAPFEGALGKVSAACKNAGLRVLGQGSASSCDSGPYYERAACAAAEGLQNNDGPVTSVLMANAGDRQSTDSYDSLYYSYMLYLVTGHRAAQGLAPSYYPNVGPIPGKEASVPGGDGGPAPDRSLSSDGGGVSKRDAKGTTPSTDSDEGGCAVVSQVATPSPCWYWFISLFVVVRIVRRRWRG